MNCQSIRNKISEVIEHILSNAVSLCFLQETFMKSHDASIVNEVKEHKLKMFSVPRLKGEHGGLGVIYNPNINLKLDKSLHRYKTFEYMECILKTKQGIFRFCNIYRRGYYFSHPYTLRQFLNEFPEYLESLVDKPGIPFILGDLNIHMEDVSNHNMQQFIDLIKEFNFTQVVPIDKPTHKLGGVLDIILCQETELNSLSNVTVYPDGTTSDHYMVSCQLQCAPELLNSNVNISYRNFNTVDVHKFKLDIQHSELNGKTMSEILDEPGSINILANLYNTELNQLMNKHCPIIYKKRSIEKRKDPWFDAELKKLQQDCRCAERKWYQTRNLNHKHAYKSVKKLYNVTLKAKRKEDHSTSILHLKTDKRKLFKKLNQLLGKDKQVLPSSANNQILADNFCQYFDNKIKKIRDDIGIEQNEMNCVVENCSECIYNGPKFTKFTEITADTLKKLLSSMSNKFSCLDPIPTWLLNASIEELNPVVLKTTNLSLKYGIFPDSWKKSVLKPTVKDINSCPETFSNYRPVSNLSFLSKLVEKVVLTQLTEHLTENSLFCSNQSGYRRFHSCETLNVKMFNDILKEMDEGSTVALLLLDMSAAFDTVDHSILLNLLADEYGISGTVLKWFESYLCNRTCSVNINNSFSDFIYLLFGVPQGSILGPILFILYTKHVQHIASKYGLSIQLYADDTQLYIGFNSMSDISVAAAKDNIENCIKEIKIWMCSKYLKLNESKTKLLFFSKPSFGMLDCFSIDVGADEIICTDWNRNSDVKSLGVYLDEHCKFDTQIAEVRKFCYGQIMS